MKDNTEICNINIIVSFATNNSVNISNRTYIYFDVIGTLHMNNIFNSEMLQNLSLHKSVSYYVISVRDQ